MNALFRRSRRAVLFVTLVALLTTLFAGSSFTLANPKEGGALRLTMPAFVPEFVSVAHAQGNTPAASIANEAGIAAYFQQPDGINLAAVRGLFRTIEADEESYIVGSMQVRDYSEKWDVHVYVSTDGWVLAYYPKDQPASRIVDSYAFDGVAMVTTLEFVLERIAGEVGRSGTEGISFYDFRYPNATHLMIAGIKGNKSFRISLPDTFSYFERSWAFGYFSSAHRFYMNDAQLAVGDEGQSWGQLTAAQLSPGRSHVFSLNSHGYGDGTNLDGFIVLVYQEGE